jgi:hypothetical protein
MGKRRRAYRAFEFGIVKFLYIMYHIEPNGRNWVWSTKVALNILTLVSVKTPLHTLSCGFCGRKDEDPGSRE